MLSLKLITSIVYPYSIFFIITGIFLLFYYKFLILKYPFLGLKIISGTMDWKGSKGKITPGRAFLSGVIGSFFPGTFFGLLFTFYFSGSKILLLLMILHLLQTSIEFILSTVSFKFRIRNKNGNIETGLFLGIEKYSRIRWLGIIFALSYIISTILVGLWNISLLYTVNFSNIMNHYKTPFILEPPSLMIFFFVFLILILNGGIRRIGQFFKTISYILVFIFLFFNISIKENVMILIESFQQFSTLFDNHNIYNTLISVIVYATLAEIPSYRLHIFSGFVRTDHSAKQGISTIMFPIIQIFFIFLVSGIALQITKIESISFNQINQIQEIFYFLHTKFFLYLFNINDGFLSKLILYFLLLLFLFSSFLSNFFCGNMITRQFMTRFQLPNIYPVTVILLYFYLIFFEILHKHQFIYDFYKILIFSLGITNILILLLALIYHNLGKFELKKYISSYEGGVDFSRDIYLIIFTILPSNLISKLFGIFSKINFPQPIMSWIILGFSKFYNVNLNEIKNHINEFKNLNSFFIRELKEGVRKIDKRKKIVVSPVDGTLIRLGSVNKGFLLQAKGIYYSLKDLIIDNDFVKYYERGKFAVFYLSPKDYHRIHAPFDCYVEGYIYVPGHLYPVNEPLVKGLYGLFSKNERISTFLNSKYGRIAMIKIGATNVGKIKVSYDSIETNQWIRRNKAVKYKHKIFYKKGMEIGRFEMGSTVILIFENDTIRFLDSCIEGQHYKFGTGFAEFI